MKKATLTSIGIIFCLVLFQGCGSCNFFSKAQKDTIIIQKKAELFSLSPELLASRSYRSRLTIILNNSDQKIINNELVNISATPQRLYMTKKIDDAHFLEIINDYSSNTFFIKSRTGDWRSGDGNKSYYQELISDALNVLVWLNQEFMLDKLFVKRGSFFEINNQPVPNDAKIITLLPSTPTESVINSRIQVDKNNIPVAANYTISMSNSSEFQLKLELELTLTQNTNLALPDLPKLSHDEALLYPVNIGTRFRKLIDPAAQP